VPSITLLVVPILAPRHATAELGWVFAGLALIHFAAFRPALLTRIGAGEPLLERTRPGMAILVAVPSVALLALDGLMAGRWASAVPGLGAALMGPR
jgi:tellurite resistance protein TehA-like permease